MTSFTRAVAHHLHFNPGYMLWAFGYSRYTAPGSSICICLIVGICNLMLCSTYIRLASEIKTNAWVLWEFMDRVNRVLAFLLILIIPLSFKDKRKSPTEACSEEDIRIQRTGFLCSPPTFSKTASLKTYAPLRKVQMEELNRVISLLVQRKEQTYAVSPIYPRPNFAKNTHKLLFYSWAGDYQLIHMVCV